MPPLHFPMALAGAGGQCACRERLLCALCVRWRGHGCHTRVPATAGAHSARPAVAALLKDCRTAALELRTSERAVWVRMRGMVSAGHAGACTMPGCEAHHRKIALGFIAPHIWPVYRPSTAMPAFTHTLHASQSHLPPMRLRGSESSSTGVHSVHPQCAVRSAAAARAWSGQKPVHA